VQVGHQSAQEQGLLNVFLTEVGIRRLQILVEERSEQDNELKADPRTWMMLKSLVTTVATPLKNVGLL